MPEEEYEEYEIMEEGEEESASATPSSDSGSVIPLPSAQSIQSPQTQQSSQPTLNEDSQSSNTVERSEPLPGEKVGSGKVMGKNGKVEKSKGREIVDGGENALKIAAIAGSGGAAAGGAAGGAAAAEGGAAAGAAAEGATAAGAAEGGAVAGKAAGANAAKGGADAASNISNASKKGKSTPGNMDNIATKKLGQVYENAKNKLADKIDEKAEKDPAFAKTVDEVATQAKKLNAGMKTVTSALSGDISGTVEGAKDLVKAFIEERIKKLKKIAITILVGIIIVALLIAAIEAYIESAIAVLDRPVTELANTHEKFDNFLNGLGFQNSEQAFYDELNKLNADHNYELNIPIIMATLYYDEMHTDGEIGLEDTSDDDGENSFMALALARRWVASKVKESNETIGADGLTYSSNKIYRLRKLARHQFDNPIFGQGTNAEEHSVSVLEYLDIIQSNIDKELLELLKSQFENIISLNNPANTAESIYQWLVAGDETFFTTDTGAHLEAIKDNLVDLLDAIFSPFFDISGVSLYGFDGCDHVVCVKYKTYGYDEDAYFNYLKKYYIKYMPEFRKYITATTDKSRDKEIDKIIADIKQVAENYEDIFGVYVRGTESYENSESCAGNIKQSIIGDMQKPVAITGDVSLSGKYAYGTSGGSSHKGVDLNNETAGIQAGMKVFSVHADGVVLESTADNTYSDSSVKGGWIKIQYSNTSGADAYKFSIIYGGLDKSSLKLKKGAKVKKGATIGKVGSKEESEDGDMPSLHFGFYDDTSNTYMDPTNLFVPCTGGYTSSTYLLHDTTSISEANFVKAITEYCKSNACSSTLKNWNLHNVFRYSVANKVNPRLVVVRAILEGFSPGSSKNNYWGIGCSNGCNSCCISYSSLESGIKGFANVGSIKNGKTIADMMKTYAYLGDVWYNPGSSSLGGCYYHTYIDKYMTSTRKSQVNNICSSSKACSGSSCTKTTQEDKDAYISWQCEKIIETDKKIFGNYVQIASTSASGGGGGAGSTTKEGKNSSGNSSVEKYVSKAIEYANDSSIGYSQSTRYFNPNVDCSSLVYFSLLNTGIIKGKKTDAFTTYTMGGVLTKYGFKKYAYKKSILQRGDIIVQPTGTGAHTVIYIGDGKQVAANGCQKAPRSCSKNGDQADEVSVSTFSDSYHNYTQIFRLE